MNDNLYAPPAAALTKEAKASPEFYAISRRKLLILSLLSYGLYACVWSYKNWSLYRKANQATLWPLARALFFVLYIHELYGLAHKRAIESGQKIDFDFDPWATAFVVLTVGARLFDSAAAQMQSWLPYKDLTLLAIPICAYILQRVQPLINCAAGDPEGLSNDRFMPWNYAVIVPGVVLWCLTFLGIWATYHR